MTGQSGVGDEEAGSRILLPARIPSFAGWSHVALGEDFTCAVARDETLWCWGKNDVGQLGLGDSSDRRAPARVGAAEDWIALAAGRRHVCAVRTSGGMYCWGGNADGQLNLGDLPSYVEPTEVCGGGVD